MHAGGDVPPNWPFDGPTPVGADERKALLDLAQDHFHRHDGNLAPVKPHCANDSGTCPALGAATVVLLLTWAPRERDVAAPARRLDVAARDFDKAVGSFNQEIAVYLQTRVARHAEAPYACVASHALRCELPARFSEALIWLRSQVEQLRTNALVPQFPESERGAARVGLLKELEWHLSSNGWTHDQIIDVLNDGNGGGPRERKGRLGKRLAYAERGFRSAPEPQDE